MSGLVLDLQHEVLKADCDILNALRKAHLIAVKLKLHEFDKWIHAELNGYEENQDLIPEYRRVRGQLKAWNPYHGWIPVILQDSKLENVLCSRKLSDSVSDILELYSKTEGKFIMTYSGDVAQKLDSMCNAPFQTNYSLHMSNHMLKSIVEKVKNCLLEWTMKLESEGILGENMQFNQEETTTAKSIPQQINNYYGPVVQGDVSGSQIVTGDNNTVTYNAAEASAALKEIRDSLESEIIIGEDKACAIEILEEISSKIEQNKKPGVIKAALVGLRDFVLSVGANVTAALIAAKIQGLF